MILRFNDDFFAWWHRQVKGIEDDSYHGIDFNKDLDMVVPHEAHLVRLVSLNFLNHFQVYLIFIFIFILLKTKRLVCEARDNHGQYNILCRWSTLA